MKNKTNRSTLIDALVKQFPVTHAMSLLKGSVYECVMLFKVGTGMAKVMEAERHLLQSGVEWSEMHILRDRPCVTWQMPANA